MRSYIIGSLALAGLHSNYANAFKYADNQVETIKDSSKLAANFPEPKNVKLLSPAFQSPESVPEAFDDGTVGPTDDATLGTILFLVLHLR